MPAGQDSFCQEKTIKIKKKSLIFHSNNTQISAYSAVLNEKKKKLPQCQNSQCSVTCSYLECALLWNDLIKTRMITIPYNPQGKDQEKKKGKTLFSDEDYK